MRFARPHRLGIAALLALTLAGHVGCGEGTVTFGRGDDGNDDAKVTFEGTIRDVTPVTSRDIVVFVFSIDDEDDSDRCPCPPDPSGSTVGKAAVVANGETAFSIPGLPPGAFGVVFLLDKAGDSADGQIDPGDDIAILDDIDCEIDDVTGNRTVTLEDVDIAFSKTPVDECSSGVSNPPASGRARADRIVQKQTPGTD